MQHSDEAAAASELAALLEEESAGTADELKTALAELENDNNA